MIFFFLQLIFYFIPIYSTKYIRRSFRIVTNQFEQHQNETVS